ncbi:RIP metalloprotease RseP [bacterium]|nr:RIP metalloprotease RseP [bacterium]
MTTLTTLLATVFVLGVLVFIHELGHLLAAKMFKIRVERFSLGFPPRMFGKQIGETDYCISWIPFGGYAKIAGMVDETMDKDALKQPPQPWEYRSRPWIQRFLVVFAGPFMNIVFTFLVFWGAAIFYGIAEPDSGTGIGEMLEGYPAAEAGLQAGDVILSVDGEDVATWDSVTEAIRGNASGTVRFRIERNDSVLTIDVFPRMEETLLNGDIVTMPKVGILPEYTTRPAGPFRSIVIAGESVWNLTDLIVTSIFRLITGRESMKSVAGPVGIAKMAGESARAGAGALFYFMALLSLNLAILNLLPIPVLDGGHLLILCIEGVTRHEISTKTKLVVQQIFMFLLLALMLYVIYNDVTRSIP